MTDKREPSRLKKNTDITANSKLNQWCRVNTDNEFNFMGGMFVIDSSVEQYKVHNKAGEVENFTNEAYMEEVLVVVSKNNSVSFYDQDYEYIEDGKIKLK